MLWLAKPLSRLKVRQTAAAAAASSEQYVNYLQQIWQPSNQEVLPCTSGQGQ